MVGYNGEVVKIRLGFVKCQLNVMNDLSVSGLSIFADLLDLCWTVTEYFSNGHGPQVTMPLMASFWEKKNCKVIHFENIRHESYFQNPFLDEKCLDWFINHTKTSRECTFVKSPEPRDHWSFGSWIKCWVWLEGHLQLSRW